MRTHLPGFQSFSLFLHHFVLVELATSSKRVKCLSLYRILLRLLSSLLLLLLFLWFFIVCTMTMTIVFFKNGAHWSTVNPESCLLCLYSDICFHSYIFLHHVSIDRSTGVGWKSSVTLFSAFCNSVHLLYISKRYKSESKVYVRFSATASIYLVPLFIFIWIPCFWPFWWILILFHLD